MKIKIKVKHNAKRCEICHQEDLFNASIDFCGRCEEVKLTLFTTPQTFLNRVESPIFSPRFVAGLIAPFILMGILGVPILFLKLLYSVGDLAKNVEDIYFLVIYLTFGVLLLGVEIFLLFASAFVLKVMLQDRY